MSQTHHARLRRGTTLIEMLVVITVITLVVGLSALTIEALTRAERQARQDRLADAALDRLAAAFRDHVHAATAVVAANHRLTITLPDERQVEYDARDRRIVVRQASATQPDPRTETVRPPPGLVPRFETITVEGQRLACLVLERSGRATIRIEAAVGRDHRFDPHREDQP